MKQVIKRQIRVGVGRIRRSSFSRKRLRPGAGGDGETKEQKGNASKQKNSDAAMYRMSDSERQYKV